MRCKTLIKIWLGKERDLMSGVVVDKGEAARGTEVNQGRGSAMAGGPEQIIGGPNLAQ